MSVGHFFFFFFFNQTLTLTLTGIQSKTCTWYAYQQAKQAGPSQRAIHTALNIFAVCFFFFSPTYLSSPVILNPVIWRYRKCVGVSATKNMHMVYCIGFLSILRPYLTWNFSEIRLFCFSSISSCQVPSFSHTLSSPLSLPLRMPYGYGLQARWGAEWKRGMGGPGAVSILYRFRLFPGVFLVFATLFPVN